MWPWEHLAIGYLAASVYVRAVHGRRIDGPALVAVLVGSQFPDLVDKPLAWEFAVFPGGTSVAHSVFVAVPLSVGAWASARRLGRATVGAAFAIAYLLHLPADALYPTLLYGRRPGFDALLWPVVTGAPDAGIGFLDQVWYYLEAFRSGLSTRRAVGYLAFEAAILLTTALAWLADGAPGTVTARRRFRARARD